MTCFMGMHADLHGCRIFAQAKHHIVEATSDIAWTSCIYKMCRAKHILLRVFGAT